MEEQSLTPSAGAATDAPRRGPVYIEDGQTYPFETDNGLRGQYRPMTSPEQRDHSRKLVKTAAEEDGTSEEREEFLDAEIVSRIKSWDLTDSGGKPVSVSTDALQRIPTERIPLLRIVLHGEPATPEWRAYAEAKRRREMIEADRLLDAGEQPPTDRFDEETVAGN